VTRSQRLAILGYQHEGDLGISGREAFTSPVAAPAHHLYVCPADSPELARHLAFRDYLRSHPGQARAYAELKRSLAERFYTDRDAYSRGKATFIESVLVRRSACLRASSLFGCGNTAAGQGWGNGIL
jgi:GrpB-like predicted nucleotidyltransferase (UPF0157 family)